jgi:hypothetical protein
MGETRKFRERKKLQKVEKLKAKKSGKEKG